ncbi:MAG: hypothetical protein ACYCOR_13820 [Acidobacteriaceae bacterium]
MEVGRLGDATGVKNPDNVRLVRAAITLWILVAAATHCDLRMTHPQNDYTNCKSAF